MIPESYHADTDSLPWAECWADDPGIRLKLLMADVEGGRFAVRMGFAPGTQVFPHKHTGEVHAITRAGSWTYLEYPDSPANVAGSYLFEPPGSTHTLKVADDADGETDVLFVIYGALVHLDDSGTILAITDAASVIEEYARRLRDQGLDVPKVPVGGAMGYRSL
ncbi:2,4'-dihydroxyacetophenone dioxygenase family protein [Altererythrobacter sp. KTW20L]|uniref:2,4'-dihydroxyacetophenone dioxygenase family protein n=1 Tax=Altererythrobacter sp. KTW20L TaxID=2942210 RepID=UPI0020BD9679|nr:2,4'-dihydroxyacetophenone dioxygenase family protein [Altererythrobacter sp. KTW20L]MCL6250195.1 2,4'-dihydroxyacetophenone dioxygenase family protein [Altererythrobacter sp. KTW20L]